MAEPSKPSAIAEQDGQPAVSSGPEHEVVDEELRAAPEEVGERRRALAGLEAVLLVDADPGQLAPPQRQLVPPPGQLLLGLEQLQPGRQPLLTRSDPVVVRRRHMQPPGCMLAGGRRVAQPSRCA
jgi:hypothetical protein